MKESAIEARLVKGVKALGGRAYKFVSPGNVGMPDRLVILPDRPPLFVELKTETGRLSKRQLYQIAQLERLGQSGKVRVLYGMADVKDFLTEMERGGDAP